MRQTTNDGRTKITKECYICHAIDCVGPGGPSASVVRRHTHTHTLLAFARTAPGCPPRASVPGSFAVGTRVVESHAERRRAPPRPLVSVNWQQQHRSDTPACYMQCSPSPVPVCAPPVPGAYACEIARLPPPTHPTDFMIQHRPRIGIG